MRPEKEKEGLGIRNSTLEDDKDVSRCDNTVSVDDMDMSGEDKDVSGDEKLNCISPV